MEYAAYCTEKRFSQEFNIAHPPLCDWPVRKVRDYLIIMDVLDEVEADQQRAANPQAAPSRPSAKQPADPDQLARLKRLATPPPMPPAS